MQEKKGYVSFVPFIHHPESDDYLEESWLYEAISETYIPLLTNFQKLVDEGVDFRITMSMTPPLLSMLDNKLLQRKYIKEFLKKLGKSMFAESAYTRLSKYFTTSNKILLDFIYCQIIDAIIIGILVSIALTIIGVKYSILLGFFIGLFNIIPYFGAIIAIAVAVLITVFTGGVQQALIMAVTVIILQQIDANIINPKILGDGLKISPILVIFAVTIGGEFFGVIGMFLSVPVIAILKLLIVDFIEIREKKKKEPIEFKNL